MIRRVGILIALIAVLVLVFWLVVMRHTERIKHVYHQRGIITIVAGNGHRGFSGDGGAATKASLHSPEGIALGKDGSLYIADRGNQRIRRVSPNGIITTIAGDGRRVKKHGYWQGRFAGDGGPAINASLNRPQGVAVSPDGSIYIADTWNIRIRKINPKGIIRTVVNVNGGLDAIHEDFDLEDLYPNFNLTGKPWHFKDNHHPATKACLGNPAAVALDQEGNLFIADDQNLRVCKVDRAGVFTCVPTGGVIGPGGAIIMKIRAGDHGPARRAHFGDVSDIAIAPDGSLYVCELYTQVIRKINPQGIITTYAGNGIMKSYTTKPKGKRDGFVEHLEGWYNGDDILATRASLDWPWGIALAPDGSLYIADMQNHRVRRVDRKGIITTVVGNGRMGRPRNGQVSTKACLTHPARLAVDQNGDLFISDVGRSQVYKVTWLRSPRRR